MRLTRRIIATLGTVAIGLLAAFLLAWFWFGQASAAQPDTFLPVVTRPPAPTATSPATPTPGRYSYTFSIDRSAAPQLYYSQLTYVVHLGPASNSEVIVDGASVTSSYNPTSGDLVFSTDRGGSATVRFAASSAAAVTVRKAALKGDKAFAWSHGMDDNVNLQAQVDLITAKGWRASLMMIAKDIDDTRDESWILDAPALKRLLAKGWSLADHSWDHNCDEGASAATLRQTMVDGYNRITQIVAASSTPGYRVLTFAAPCFISAYNPVFDALVARGDTTMRLHESQGNPLMNVDGADYSAGNNTAAAMSAAVSQIGRDTTIESGPESAIATLDWMAANASAGRHFWFNSLTHGNQEANLGQVLDHAYASYGPGGSDTLWMAPSDEIYSYLLIRDTTVVTPGQLLPPGN